MKMPPKVRHEVVFGTSIKCNRCDKTMKPTAWYKHVIQCKEAWDALAEPIESKYIWFLMNGEYHLADPFQPNHSACELDISQATGVGGSDLETGLSFCATCLGRVPDAATAFADPT